MVSVSACYPLHSVSPPVEHSPQGVRHQRGPVLKNVTSGIYADGSIERFIGSPYMPIVPITGQGGSYLAELLLAKCYTVDGLIRRI